MPEMTAATGGSRAPGAPQVDVWRLPLLLAPGRVAELNRCLSSDEDARHARMPSSVRRDRARVAWAYRRVILARYLGCEPQDVAIVRREGRAPAVSATGRPPHFSLSHSGDWMLFAASRHVVLGVDIERVDSGADVVRLARRFFSPGEAAALSRLPDAERPGAFFRIWTAKEAVLKGAGGGVPSRLRAVPAGVAEDGRHAGLRFAGMDWTLHGIDAPEGYAATLATSGDVVVHVHGSLEGGPIAAA
jgi:4'-phosphopantetheinyl transferase